MKHLGCRPPWDENLEFLAYRSGSVKMSPS